MPKLPWELTPEPLYARSLPATHVWRAAIVEMMCIDPLLPIIVVSGVNATAGLASMLAMVVVVTMVVVAAMAMVAMDM